MTPVYALTRWKMPVFGFFLFSLLAGMLTVVAAPAAEAGSKEVCSTQILPVNRPKLVCQTIYVPDPPDSGGLPTNPGTPVNPGTPGTPGTPGGGSGLGPGSTNWIYYSDVEYYWDPNSTAIPGSLGTGPTFIPGSVDAYYSGSNYCGGSRTTQWGKYIGVQVSQAGRMKDDLQNGNGAYKDQTLSDYECIHPPHYEETPITCAYSAGAKATGPYNNPTVPAKVFYNSGPVLSAFVRGGSKSVSLCTSGMTQNFNASATDYGRYKIEATGKATACTFRQYTTADARTGRVPADVIVGCRGQFPFAVGSAKYQLFCPKPGFSIDWSGNHTFTTQECLSASAASQTWSCGPQTAQKGSYAGLSNQSSNFTVIDDGKNRSARWNTPVLKGISKARAKQARLDWLSGTPFRLNSSAGSSEQPFTVTPKADAWAAGWSGVDKTTGKTGFYVNFQAAGMPSKPWTARPQWKFTGDFTVKKFTVTSVDWRTGKMTTSITNVKKTMSATCTGQPVSINSTRARISN